MWQSCANRDSPATRGDYTVAGLIAVEEPTIRNYTAEKQITSRPHGHILTNTSVWSPAGKWIIYDVRSDPAGSLFDGQRIERIHADTRKVQIVYEACNDARVGVAMCSPVDDRVNFIHGPEHPTPDWSYSATHRQGVILSMTHPGAVENLDARDLTPPFTPGALRGGTHVHTFDSRGKWVAFTYEDHVLAELAGDADDHDPNQRNVGVSVPGRPVAVNKCHPRNHDGSHFSVLVTRTVAKPQPGSDDISRAYEDAWVGVDGYLRPDGTRQRRAIAFQGDLVTRNGKTIAEVFIVDLPDDVAISGDGPLEGTTTRRPCPPQGTRQRRLTFSADRTFPGIQGPRHWLRSSPDGSRIAFLMKDDRGIVQLWTISPNSPSGEPRQLSHHPWNIASAFTWSPDGRFVAHVMDTSVFITDSATGEGVRLTPQCEDDSAPRPEACVFSPDGDKIAYVKPVHDGDGTHNQIFVVEARSISLATNETRVEHG
jgi:hypothetical protein